MKQKKLESIGLLLLLFFQAHFATLFFEKKNLVFQIKDEDGYVNYMDFAVVAAQVSFVNLLLLLF